MLRLQHATDRGNTSVHPGKSALTRG